MTNLILLKQKIKASGYKIAFIAKMLGISRAGLYLKLNGTNDFTVPEIKKLCTLLGIKSLRDKETIFFADGVAEKSTM